MRFIKTLTAMMVMVSGFIFGSLTMAQAAEPSYQLSTHVLDISRGMPAKGVVIELSRLVNENGQEKWVPVGKGTTDENGRIKTFLEQKSGQSNAGIYKLKFLTKAYFDANKEKSFYPYIEVVFEINDDSHYHVPITLSNFGYSTYRGS